MSENFRDYLIGLADDPDLLAKYKKDPKDTLLMAAISSEERAALLKHDKDRIRALLKGAEVPKKVDELIASL
jgi:hypothetical protein